MLVIMTIWRKVLATKIVNTILKTPHDTTLKNDKTFWHICFFFLSPRKWRENFFSPRKFKSSLYLSSIP